MNFLLAIHLI